MAIDRLLAIRLITWLSFAIIIAFVVYGFMNPLVKEITTEVEINASEDSVWKVLTDFSSYPHWNPFITSISGPLKPGSELLVSIELPSGRSTIFDPKVTSVQKNKEFKWLGSLWMGNIYDAENVFQISPAGDGRTRLVHSEVFKGVLVPVYADRLETEYTKAFEEMNVALKARTEALYGNAS